MAQAGNVQTYNQKGEKVYPIVDVSSFTYGGNSGKNAYKDLISELPLSSISTNTGTMQTLNTDVANVNNIKAQDGDSITITGNVKINGTLDAPLKGLKWEEIPRV